MNTIINTSRRSLPGVTTYTASAARLSSRPRLRPGCAPMWLSNSRLVIGPRPSMDVIGTLEQLSDIAVWVAALDGTRDYAMVTAEHPQHRPLLDALIDAGCVLALHMRDSEADDAEADPHNDLLTNIAPAASAGPVTAADTAEGEPSRLSDKLERQHVSALCLHEASSRVTDDFIDDASALAWRRANSAVTVVGSLPLVRLIEDLLAANGANVVDLTETSFPVEPTVGDNSRPARTKATRAQTSVSLAIIATVEEFNEPHLDDAAAAVFQRAGVPHMCVSVAGSRLICGPWVAPGSSPCTHCWNLRRVFLLPTEAAVPAARVPTRAQHSTAALSLAASLAAARAVAAIDGFVDVGLPEVLLWDGIGSMHAEPVVLDRNCGCSLQIDGDSGTRN